MSARERETRRHLVYYLEVYDTSTEQMIGHLADITTNGVKVVGEEPVAAEDTYNLRIVWKQSDILEEDIELEAECLWSGKDINPSLHASGFRFVNPSQAIQRHIESIISQIGFRDTD